MKKIILLLALSSNAFALDQIIHPYMSVRSEGMGGVRYTTGLYDENFFANPARATANPKFRFSLFDLQTEINSNTINTVQNLTKGGDALKNLASSAGDDNHGRIQLGLLEFFMPPGEDSKTAFAFGLIESTQFDIDLRRSYQLSPQAIADVGPAFTVARRFMENDELSVGLTGHLMYRLSSNPNFSLVDLLKGSSISPAQSGGEGAMFDFDVGGTYKLPFTQWDWDFSTALAIDNVLGGNYSNLKLDIINTGVHAQPQPRSYSAGIVAHNAAWKKLTDTLVAIEFTDVGNNPDGGMFRLIHIGAESHYGLIAMRVGINQGYFTAGVGFDLKVLNIEAATYGEEMSDNPGNLEDRRYAFRLQFKI
jgi:hypothetical protein